MSRSEERISPVTPHRSHHLELVCERFYLREVLRSVVATVLFHRLLFAAAHTRPREVEMNAIDFAYVRVDDPEVNRVVEERLAHCIRLVDAAAPPTPQGPTAAPSASYVSVSNRRNSFSAGIPVVRCQLTVAFSERRSKKSWFAGSYDEDVVWEEWILSLSVKSSKTDVEHERSKRALERDLPALLMNIAALAHESRDIIPKLTAPPNPSPSDSNTGSGLSANPFPWSIVVGNPSQGYLPLASPAEEAVPPARSAGYVLDEDTSGSVGRNEGWTSLLKRMVTDTASVAGLGGGLGGLSR